MFARRTEGSVNNDKYTGFLVFFFCRMWLDDEKQKRENNGAVGGGR